MKNLAASVMAFACSLLHGKGESEYPPLDQARCIACVAKMENAPVSFVSRTGNRGIYGLSRRVWARWSDKPFAWANGTDNISEAVTRNVAIKEAFWIIADAIPSLNLPATPYSFALLWNAGYGHVSKLDLSSANVDYARRFRNCYEDKTW